MNTDRELMQQALEALLEVNYDQAYAKEVAALRERLAQPEQEPVATVESVATVVSESGNQEVTMSWWHEPALPVGTKLYTTPPQRKPLTDDDFLNWYDNAIWGNEDFKEGCWRAFEAGWQAAHGIKGEA